MEMAIFLAGVLAGVVAMIIVDKAAKRKNARRRKEMERDYLDRRGW